MEFQESPSLDDFARSSYAEVDAIMAARPRYQWHLAVTDGHDKQAADALRRRKYRVYWPNYPAIRRVGAGRLAPISRSIFPGYLFVLPGLDGWERLRESPGIHGLKMMTAEYGEKIFATFWDDEPDFRRIEALEREMREIPKKTAKYRVGDRVKVRKGPMIELFGRLIALDDEKGRVHVLEERLKRITCTYDQLSPA